MNIQFLKKFGLGWKLNVLLMELLDIFKLSIFFNKWKEIKFYI